MHGGSRFSQFWSSGRRHVGTRQVPSSWSKCYPSLKPLGAWMRDLIQRAEHIRGWAMVAMPKVFWLPCMTYPSGETGQDEKIKLGGRTRFPPLARVYAEDKGSHFLFPICQNMPFGRNWRQKPPSRLRCRCAQLLLFSYFGENPRLTPTMNQVNTQCGFDKVFARR